MASQPKPVEAEPRKLSFDEMQTALGPIIKELDGLAATAVSRRAVTEERWMRNLRQFHGIYDSSISNVLTSDESRSKTFINITRPKTNAWAARLGDMLFPNDEKNWGIQPTPVPDLTDHARAAVAEAERLDQEAEQSIEQHNEAVDAGQEPDPAMAQQAGAAAAKAKRLRDSYDETQIELEEVRRRARNMERLIDDQLTESRYPAQARKSIEDACKLGPGIIKGPIVSSTSRPVWELTDDKDGGEDKSYQMVPRKDAPPMYKRINPWHFFPDPDAEDIEDARYILERHLPNKKILRRLARQLGFEEKAVKRLLDDGPEGHAAGSSRLDFLAELRSLENGGTGASDNSNPSNDRYTVWEFYGALEVEQVVDALNALGRSEDAERYKKEVGPLEERMVRIFFCQDYLLKIEEDYLLDSGDFLYSVFGFEKAESSILGSVGVPELMHNEQGMLNSAVRMMNDNAALSVAPQMIVDKEVVQPENGSWKVTPRKVWHWLSNKNGARKEAPFTAINIPMNQEQLSAIIALSQRFVDEAIAMPLIAQGEQGAHVTKTSSGMSMLFNSANVVFRRVVKNWDDDMTTPTILRSYDFNMQFAEDEQLKGDMKVEARGTSVLLVREIQAEQLMNIIDRYSAHPILGVALKAYGAMRLVLQAMSINPNDVLLDEEDYLEKLGQMSEGDDSQDPEILRQETALQVAKLDYDRHMKVAESNIQVANIRRETEMMQLAQNRELSMEQIKAMFANKKIDAQVKVQTEKMKTDSAERKLASETAVEMQNAREARAKGLEPDGSGGTISLGTNA